MPYLILPERFKRQPQGPVEIDFNHPLAPMLDFVQVGRLALNLKTGKTRDAGTGTPTVGAGSIGVGRKYNSTSDYYSGNAGLDAATSGSVLVVAKTTSIPSYAGHVCHTSNLGTNAGWSAWQSNGTNLGFYNGAGTFSSFGLVPSDITGANVSHMGCTFQANEVKGYLNGRLLSTNTAAGCGTPTTGSGYLKIAASRDVDTLVSTFFLVYVWRRVLGAGAYVELFRNPWQLLKRPLANRLYFFPTAGGAYSATFTAATLDWTPQTVSVNARKQVTLTSPTVGYTTNAISTAYDKAVALTAAAFSFTTNAISTAYDKAVALTAATFSFTANAITLTLGAVHTLSTASLSFTTNAISTAYDKAVALTGAVWVFSANALSTTLPGVSAALGKVVAFLRRRRRV